MCDFNYAGKCVWYFVGIFTMIFPWVCEKFMSRLFVMMQKSHQHIVLLWERKSLQKSIMANYVSGSIISLRRELKLRIDFNFVWICYTTVTNGHFCYDISALLFIQTVRVQLNEIKMEDVLHPNVLQKR